MELDGSKMWSEAIIKDEAPSMVLHSSTKEIFRITPEGEFIFGEGVTPSEAAQQFAAHYEGIVKDSLRREFERGREFERHAQEEAKRQVDRIHDNASLEASKALQKGK